MPLFHLSWWELTALVLLTTHVTIILVTVYFHRCVSHRAFYLSDTMHRVFRFLAWWLTGMSPQEFAAVHRKHHAKCDTPEDPHSPVHRGWAGVLFFGTWFYQKEAKNPDTVKRYGHGMHPDPLDGFYRRFPNLGVVLFLGVSLALFGWKGLVYWGVHMLWIPVWAAGVINGLGHHIGYRRTPTDDASTNLVPWGIFIGGEELHNNHHADPVSPKLSRAWFEFDIGWVYIRALVALGQATLRPSDGHLIHVSTAADAVDHHGALDALLRRRYECLAQFHKSLNRDVHNLLRAHGFRRWSSLSRLADRDTASLSPAQRSRVELALAHPTLNALRRLEVALKDLWTARRRSMDSTVEAFQHWLTDARAHAMPSLSALCDRWTSARWESPSAAV